MKKYFLIKLFATIFLYSGCLQASQDEFLVTLRITINNNRDLIQTSPQVISDILKERDPENFNLVFNMCSSHGTIL